MNVQTIKIAGKRFVVIPEKEFRRLLTRLDQYAAEEQRDAAIIRKRTQRRKGLIPLAQVKKELGL